MHSSMLYHEMNNGGSVVPSGGFSPGGRSPGGSEGYGSGSECQVPSPSQWSDPCYSPPSLHSPQHLPNDHLLDKIKEEPFSPPPPSGQQHHYTGMPSPPPGVPQQQQQGQQQGHPPPYARPQQQQQQQQQQQMMQPLQNIKKEGYETSVNLLQLLAENHALNASVQHQQQVPQQQQHKVPQVPQVPQQQQHQQQQQQKVSQHQQQVYYPDHPLLRERLEDDSFQMNKPADAFDPSTQSFLDSLVEVKKEVEEEVSVGSVCGSPAAPSPGVVSPAPAAAAVKQQQATPTPTTTSDILETVELLALEHARRDLQRVSDSLGIPRDPAQWSVDDVRSWLKLQASQLQLPPLMLDFWNLAGPALLKLTEAQFRQLAPVGGELLHAQLEIWHQALRFSATPYYHHQLQQQAAAAAAVQQQQQQQQQQQHHQQQQLHNMFMAHQHHLQQQQAAEALVAQQQQQQQAPQPPSGSGGIIPLTIQVPGGPQQSPPGVGPHSPPQASAAGMNSPGSQQGNAGTGVYMEEACLDMAALLAQSGGGGTSKTPSPQQGQTAQGNQPLDHLQHHDNYDSDDEDVEETGNAPVGRGGGTHIHLWQFLKELLQQPQLYGSCIRWLDRQKGIFKIEDSVRVARLWGKRKNRPAMNYDKLSRSIRQYYKKGIMKKTERSQRLVYQFCHPYCL